MKVLRLLRSRRLAVWLVAGITVYAWVSTLVPLSSVDAEAVLAWDRAHPALATAVNLLGLHDAFSSPIFLVAVGLLTACTAACAWERSSQAVRALAWAHAGSRQLEERLSTAPSLVLSVTGASAEASIAGAATALRGLGLRVRRDGDTIRARSGTAGWIGSPLFHWALVALFLFAGAGRLTRYEGYATVLIGGSFIDSSAAYRTGLFPGAFSSGLFTGARVVLEDVDPDFSADGVARGATPRVSVQGKDASRREQWVYPNAPLTFGPLVIHGRESGPALVGTVSRGNRRERLVLYFRPGVRSERFTLSGSSSSPTVTASVTAVPGSRVRVVPEGGTLPDAVLGIGDTAKVSTDTSLTLDALTGYSQLKVVNDWSVPWLYASFAAGILGLSLTLVLLPRSVTLQGVSSEGGASIRVLVSSTKRDRAFPRRVGEALTAAVGPAERHEEASA